MEQVVIMPLLRKCNFDVPIRINCQLVLFLKFCSSMLPEKRTHLFR